MLRLGHWRKYRKTYKADEGVFLKRQRGSTPTQNLSERFTAESVWILRVLCTKPSFPKPVEKLKHPKHYLSKLFNIGYSTPATESTS